MKWGRSPWPSQRSLPYIQPASDVYTVSLITSRLSPHEHAVRKVLSDHLVHLVQVDERDLVGLLLAARVEPLEVGDELGAVPVGGRRGRRFRSGQAPGPSCACSRSHTRTRPTSGIRHLCVRACRSDALCDLCFLYTCEQA